MFKYHQQSERWFNNLVKYSNIHALHTEAIKYAINHGCPARATIHVTDVDEENEKKTEYTLIKVSHPQHHITHLPDHINIIADQILVKMKECMETFWHLFSHFSDENWCFQQNFQVRLMIMCWKRCCLSMTLILWSYNEGWNPVQSSCQSWEYSEPSQSKATWQHCVSLSAMETR